MGHGALDMVTGRGSGTLRDRGIRLLTDGMVPLDGGKRMLIKSDINHNFAF